MSIRVKLGLGLVSALVLLIGVGFIAEYQLRRSVEEADRVSYTREVLTELQELSAALRSAEYYGLASVLSVEQEPRAQFHAAKRQVMSDFTRLRTLTRDDARQQRELDYLRPLLVRVLTIAENAMAERQENVKDLADACSLAVGASKQPMQQIERSIQEIKIETQEVHRERSRAWQISSQVAANLVGLGTVLAVTIVLLLARVIAQDLRRREGAEIALLEVQQGLEARVHERTVDLSNMAGRYRLLFEDSPLPMVVFDVETLCFLAVNAAAEHLYGYARDEFLAMTLRDTQPPEEVPVLLEVLKTIEPDEAYRTTFVSQHKSGQLLTVEVRASSIEFGGHNARLALITDITEQKRLEAQLQQSQKMEAVGRLAGGIAHDFNNLLTVILGYSDLILRKLDKNDPLHSKVSEIQAAGQRAANLTGQLLAFSRKQVLKSRVLDLNTVVSNISQMLRRLLGEDIEVSLHLDPDLGQVRADPRQLEQVLVNLAVPNGGSW